MSQRMTPDGVARRIALACGVSVEEIRLTGRHDLAAEARQIAAWIMREATDWTLEQIGAALGRDSTAASRIIEKADGRRRRDALFKDKADRQLRRIKADMQEREHAEPAEPMQFELEMPTRDCGSGDINWGFQSKCLPITPGRMYFAELNVKAVAGYEKGLKQEMRERRKVLEKGEPYRMMER